MIITGGKVFDGAGFVERGDAVVGERFADAAAGDASVVDATGCYVIPGLVDVHFHGCKGHDFCEGTEEAFDVLARYEASRGVTAICPATMTYPEEVLAPVMDCAAAYEAMGRGSTCGHQTWRARTSPGNIGAQNPAYLHGPDVAMFGRLPRIVRAV